MLLVREMRKAKKDDDSVERVIKILNLLLEKVLVPEKELVSKIEKDLIQLRQDLDSIQSSLGKAESRLEKLENDIEKIKEVTSEIRDAEKKIRFVILLFSGFVSILIAAIKFFSK